MNKSIKKFSPRDAARSAAVKWVAKKVGCTHAYIYKITANNFSGDAPPELMDAYKKKYQELKQVMS